MAEASRSGLTTSNKTCFRHAQKIVRTLSLALSIIEDAQVDGGESESRGREGEGTDGGGGKGEHLGWMTSGSECLGIPG